MNRLVEVPRGAVAAIRGKLSGVTHQSKRTLLLGTVLLTSSLSAAIGFIATQYFSADVLSVLAFRPDDCWPTWVVKVGRHCFGDYQTVLAGGMRPNPWLPYRLSRRPGSPAAPKPLLPERDAAVHRFRASRHELGRTVAGVVRLCARPDRPRS